MVRLLVLGDTHIPDRAPKIPRRLEDIISLRKPWEVVIFTGDLTSRDILAWLQELSDRVYVVRGNMDYLPLPKTQAFEVEGIKFGIHHGDGIFPRGDPTKLTQVAKSLDVEILISGHTHSDFVKLSSTGHELLLNPGSLTGVWGGGGGSFVPSFITLEVANNMINIKTYKLQKENFVETSLRALRAERKWILEK
ncbi:MAG: YfcE family phosphodiesterase [Desulfurococcaceae archaeon]